MNMFWRIARLSGIYAALLTTLYAAPQDYTTETLYPARWLMPSNEWAQATDVASNKLGRTWDFEQAGDLQGFGHWAGVTNVAVKAGALQFEIAATNAGFGWGNVDGKQPLKDQMSFPHNGSVNLRVRQTQGTSQWNVTFMHKTQPVRLLYPNSIKEVTGTNWQTISFGWLASAIVDGFQVTITSTKGNEILIDSIQPLMWKRRAYFRKTVTLPEGKIFRAVVNVAKKERFFVNGEEMALPRDKFFAAKAYHTIGVDIAKYLRSGENVFGIMVDGSWQNPIVYLHGGIVLDSGERIPVGTDETWKMSGEAPEGWNKPGFDDSAWLPPGNTRQYNIEHFWGDDMPIPHYTGRIVLENPYEEKLYYQDQREAQFKVGLPPGLQSQSPVLRYVIMGADRNQVAQGELKDFQLEAGRLQGLIKAAPLRRGVYELETELAVAGKVLDRRVEIFIVAGKLPQQEVEGKDYEEGLKLKLVDTINCSDPQDPHPFMDGDSGPSRIVKEGKLVYREAAACRGAGKLAGHFAYRYQVKNMNKLHLVAVEYPDDKTRAMQVQICNLPELTAEDWKGLSMWSISKTGSGALTGGRFPCTGQMQKLRLLYGPDMAEQMIMVVTAGQGKPAAAGRILIYEVEGELPALRVESGGERRVGLHTERAYSFATPLAHRFPAKDKKLAGSMWGAGWRPETFRQQMQVIEDYVEYMRFCGENMYLAGAYQYGDHNTPYPESPLVKDARLELDYRDLMCKVFEYNDIIMLAGVEYNWAERLLYFEDLSPSDGEVARGADTMWVVDCKGEQCDPASFNSWSPGPPTTVANIFHPAVAQSLARIVADLCKRWARYPAFKGVVFSSYPGEIGLVLGDKDGSDIDFLSKGYDDRTIRQFEQEIGIKVPGAQEDYERFQKRYEWLQQNASAQWLQWRCRRMVELQKRLLREMKGYRTDLKLYNLFYNRLACIEDWLFLSGDTFQKYMERMAQDFTLYRTEPDLIAGRFIYNSLGNWRFYNRQPEVIQAFDRPLDRTVMIHCPFDENYVSHKWTREFPWEQYLADGPEPSTAFHETFTQSLMDSDADTIFYGWMDGNIIFGQEENRRKFNQAFVALPKGRFEEVRGLEIDRNVAVKELRQGDQYYFYVVNPGWWENEVTVQLNKKAKITDLASGTQEQGAKVNVKLGPYGVRSYRVEGGGRVAKVATKIARKVRDFFAEDLANLRQLADLPDSRLLLSAEEQADLDAALNEMATALQEGIYREIYERREEPKLGNMIATLKAVGKLRAWQVIGPFKNSRTDEEFQRALEVEADILGGRVDFTKSYPGIMVTGNEAAVKWQHTLSGASWNGHEGFLDFNKCFSVHDWSLAYAFTQVFSPEEREVKLTGGSDDGIRVWVNRKLVIDHYIARGAVPKQDTAEIVLRKGWNEVLVKVENQVGGWGFFLEFEDQDGAAVKDLIFSPSGEQSQIKLTKKKGEI